jgi:hypothetical protein
MIRAYKVYYRVFWTLPDDPEGFERETEERAFTAEDALTQVRVKIDLLCRHKRIPLNNFPFGPYEITKIEPMEEKER